jgi:hypothetical protein
MAESPRRASVRAVRQTVEEGRIGALQANLPVLDPRGPQRPRQPRAQPDHHEARHHAA